MNVEDFKLLMELRGVYDGWSVGVLPDGTMVNRWEKDDEPRYSVTQKFIDIYGGKYDWDISSVGDRPLKQQQNQGVIDDA